MCWSCFGCVFSSNLAYFVVVICLLTNFIDTIKLLLGYFTRLFVNRDLEVIILILGCLATLLSNLPYLRLWSVVTCSIICVFFPPNNLSCCSISILLIIVSYLIFDSGFPFKCLNHRRRCTFITFTTYTLHQFLDCPFNPSNPSFLSFKYFLYPNHHSPISSSTIGLVINYCVLIGILWSLFSFLNIFCINATHLFPEAIIHLLFRIYICCLSYLL